MGRRLVLLHGKIIATDLADTIAQPVAGRVVDVSWRSLVSFWLEGRTVLATPPAGTGWLDVDLSGYSLTVSGDFYVGFLYSEQHSDPSLGVDNTSPDGRSYEVPWSEVNYDYMIRAVIMSP